MTPLLALAAPAALAAVTRLALVVGNDEGAPDTEPLLFAEYDAEKVWRTLTDVGGVAPGDAELLLGAPRTRLLHAMGRVRERIAEVHAAGGEALLLFYYSGHADDEGLELGRTRLTWDELDRFLEYSEAEVRVALVDACRSGRLARAKGGSRAPAFVLDLTDRLDSKGQVVITSSAADEASQESDEIGGSYFTHFLVSALVGAGDADGDGRVTLSEAYRFVYRETVFRTRDSLHGTQHPSYAWELSGEGDVVLAELGRARASLTLPASLVGRFAIFDRTRREFVAEIELDGTAPRTLHLRPGRYLVQERFPTHLNVAEVELVEGEETTLDAVAFAPVEYEEDVAKGSVERRIRRARSPRLSARLQAGLRAFADEEVQSAYFPTSGAAGLSARWTWAHHQWIGVDLLGGAAEGALSIEELPYPVPVRVAGTTLGLAAGVGTGPRLLRAAAGLRLAATWLYREFPGQGVDPQSLFTVAPGVLGRVGLYPGRAGLELEWRFHHLPFVIDERDTGVAFHEVVFSVGARF